MAIGNEVGIVGRAGGEALPPCQEHVEHVSAVGAVVVVGAAGVEDLDGVDRPERHHVTIRHGVPLRVGGDDKGPGLERAARQLRSRLLQGRASEIERQSDGQDVPGRSQLHPILRWMQLRAENRREGLRAKRSGVDERPAVLLQKVLGQRQEVVPRCLIEAADLLRRAVAVRERRVRVQVAPPEATGPGKQRLHRHLRNAALALLTARTGPGRLEH